MYSDDDDDRFISSSVKPSRNESSDDEIFAYIRQCSTAQHSNSQHSEPIPSGALAADNKIWPSHRRYLRVSFLNGSDDYQERVKCLVNENNNTLNLGIKFQFISLRDSLPADIRVKFTSQSWSQIGCNAQDISSERATLKLNMHNSLKKVQADILHEFGHALGLIHEHKHWDCKLQWNYPRLVSRLNWSESRVHKEYDRNERMYVLLRDKPYDLKSIMHYTVKIGDTLDGQTEIPLDIVLSDGDKEMLLSRYPHSPPIVTEKQKVEPKKQREKKEEKNRRDVVNRKQVPNTQDLEQQPVCVSDNSKAVVRGGYIVVSGNATAIVRGGGHVVVTGNASGVVYGYSFVQASDNGSVFVHGSGSAMICNNSRAGFSGRAIGEATGNGSVRSSVSCLD